MWLAGMVLAGHSRFEEDDMEKIDLNGTTVDAEVVERDHNGNPSMIRYEGAELLYRDSVGKEYQWLMVVGHSPLQAARDLLKADYESDVETIADDVRQRVASGELDTREAIERFVHESCDGSYRMSNSAAQREILIYSSNTSEVDGEGDLTMMAFYAYEADVYDDLGDIDELLVENESDEDDEDPEGDDDEHDTP